ncbi:LTA synthase family protein [Evansella tamaricis]|uniref:Sulfatase-like hydrolase/transferase n=1 Tax=Evansella tamaricis TaxID=2069301 RepID=A0ABS6JLU7_9BACI|nr:alkaline phosphatase family protein [Evansella tamaricis]MBU9714189.1 sulfatase-like hydrolase/transferase [Evansella tamaricis]
MLNIVKVNYLLFYFFLSILYMESLLRIATTGRLFSFGFLLSIFFSFSFAIILFLLSTFYKKTANYIIATSLLVFTAIIFSSQLLYHNTFRTFYSMYSASNASQLMGFWRDILALLSENTIWILTLFFPAVLLIILRKKIFTFERMKWQYRTIFILMVIVFHVIGVAAVFGGGKEQHSAHDLYFKTNNSFLSVERLGLITTMRIDFQRHLTGWSPTIEVSSPFIEPIAIISEPDHDYTTEEKGLENTKISDEIYEDEVEYNVLDIDFDSLISTEDNDTLKKMHEYFQSVPPTEKNDFTGKYEGYNLVLLTAEAFSPYAVHEELTPTLFKLVHEGYHFTNFYTPLWEVSTSDGEYVALTGLIPKSGVWSFHQSSEIAQPFVLGNQLNTLNYKTVAYHNHSYSYYHRNLSHPNMGYDYKGIGNGLIMEEAWPRSDLEMMEITIPEYINEEPFLAYYMTVSGHLQYNFSGNNMAHKNRHYVDDLPLSSAARAYIATQIELDRALEYLLSKLHEKGIADRTLIALSTDHYPYGLEHEEIEELAGNPVDETFELHQAPFILYTEGMEPQTIDKPSSSLDILPTLSNLLGLEYDSRLMMGTDIFSESDPLVIFQDRSFITDYGRYNARTGEFIPIEGTDIENDYVDWISSVVDSKFYYSSQILDNNYYDKVLNHSN